MKNIIIKAIAKTNKTNAKTAHVPFYKSVSAPVVSAPVVSVNDVYSFTLRYIVEMYPAVKPFENAFCRTAKRFHVDLLDIENKGILNMYSANTYIYKFLWIFFNELKNNEYAWNIGDNETTYYRHFLLVSLSNNYFNRFIEACEQ